jgi:hypothetical protein
VKRYCQQTINIFITRRVRLKEFWFDEDTPAQIPSTLKFYRKTLWQPPKDRDAALEAYSSNILTRTTSYVPQPPKYHISKASRLALSQLNKMVQDRTIRISTADKGGAIVVQDFDQYCQEAHRQLNNPTHYERLQTDPTKDIAATSNEFFKELYNRDIINEKTMEWGLINKDSVKTHTFYHLPKIHKDPTNPPGRPIVSGVGGPTERLSKLVDHWLQPVVQRLPSFLKDTTHFLDILQQWQTSTPQPIPEDALIVTIDVVALYPSIPHDEVAVSLRSVLTASRDTIDVPPTPLLLKIVNHILNNNVFQFDGQLFRQVQGTAMGTPMAPAIANIFMGWLEDRLLNTSPIPIDPQFWRRFIDDIVMLWLHGEDKLKEFLAWLNTQHHSIKFTSNYGRTNIPYLDVSISIVDGKLTTDVHTKPTDAHMYLPFHSCHPRHCLRGIPYGQCIRLRRICSEDDVFQHRTQELKERLVKRGYPPALIDVAISKVTAIPRSTTLTYKKKTTNTNRVPFIITHNPTHPPVAQWLKELMPNGSKS